MWAEPEWLSEHLDDDDVRILDASWHLPSEGRDARAEFAAAHIPGAMFFDIDAVSDGSSLPHMLPRSELFAAVASALGIDGETQVVVYDQRLFSAPRAWWTFRVFGHERVSVLRGGLSAWRAAGRPLSDQVRTPRPRRFVARFHPERVRALADVRAALADGSATVVDARGRGRFVGSSPEPRPGVKGGHMPGSKNLPYTAVLDAEGALLPPEGVRAAFAAASVDLERPIVTTCGSGITAALLSFALHGAGLTDVPVYDGSWAEWGARDDTPIVTGE